MRTNILTTTFLAKISVLEISRDLGHRNIVFIRFNPDDYMIGNEKITSCWEQNKTGIFAVKSQRRRSGAGLNALKKKVKECLEKNGRIR
jgi:hypothetical protein